MSVPNKILRGKVLAFLCYMSPKRVDIMGIAGVYIDYYTLAHIEKAVAYLLDRGYITAEKKAHPYVEREQVALYAVSSKGVDLHEGTIKDDGISVGDY